MDRSSKSAWIHCFEPDPGARLRLFCVPYAGGGASVYRGWPASLPPGIELCAIQLPGRETRIAEPRFSRMGPLVEALREAVAPWLDRPYALFGHSMGAEVAFELVRALRRTGGPQPRHLFVSARPAPQRPRRPPLHHLPHDAFVAQLRRLGGTPDAVLASPELMELVIPVLRADFAVLETNGYQAEPPLDCPISAFHGVDDDRATEEDMQAWAAQTAAAFRLRAFPGGHFFLHQAKARLIQMMVKDLEREPD